MKSIVFIVIFLTYTLGFSQQTEFYLGFKDYPAGQTFLGRSRILPVNNDDYYLIQQFNKANVDSIQYKRYNTPYVYSTIINEKTYTKQTNFNYDYGVYCVVNYMRKDKLINTFTILCANDTGKLPEVGLTGATVSGRNLVISGRFSGDSLMVKGAGKTVIKKVGGWGSFLLCVGPTGKVLFNKNINGSSANAITDIMLFKATPNGIPVYRPGAGSPDLSAFSSISSSIYSDSLVSGLFTIFDTMGQSSVFAFGTMPDVLYSFPKGTMTADNKFTLIGSYSNYFKYKSPVNQSHTSANGKLNPSIAQTTYTGVISLYEIQNSGQFSNHYWIKGKGTNSLPLSIQNVPVMDYYKSGYLLQIVDCDSFEFGKNNNSWGKFSLKNGADYHSIVFVDTILQKLHIKTTLPNSTWAHVITDSSYLVIGTRSSGTGFQNMDVNSGQTYYIKDGPYIAEYRNNSDLAWARNDQYGPDIMSNNSSSRYLFSVNSPRTDMEYGSKVISRLYFSQFTHWITKLNCKPIADFTYNIIGGCVACTYTGALRTNIKWDFGDGQKLNGNRYPTHCYTTNGTFDVKVIVSNSCGTDTAVWPITITEASRADLSYNKISVFPNPAKNYFIASLPGNSSDFDYRLFSIDGRCLQIGNGNINSPNYFQSSISSGVYLIEIQIGQEIDVVRLIIE